MNGMIEVIGWLFATILIACTFTSISVWLHLTPNVAPYAMGTEVRSAPPESASCAKIDDSMIPEIRFDSKAPRCPTGYSAAVQDKQGMRPEFPMGGI